MKMGAYVVEGNADMVQLLCRMFRYKEIGWKEIGAVFYRWTLFKTPWFSIYLHRLDAKLWHDKYHDHPWWFIALILCGGYWELDERGKTLWRSAGSLLYRRAEFKHNVMTPTISWSLVIVGRKTRKWELLDCRSPSSH